MAATSTAFHAAAAVHRRSSIRHRSDLLLRSSAVFKPITITTASLSYSAALAISPTAAASSSTEQSVAFDVLEQLLSSKNYRQADEETRRLLIVLAGEAAQKRGYVFFSEAQFISEDDLRRIDELWTENSDNRFGYSVQRKIWEKCNRDFTKFFIKVGWMKKLEGSEVVQYNYRSFPTEFVWELEETTPEAHLPLTNALRGTQLLNSIFTHPAFTVVEEDEGGAGGEEEERKAGAESPLNRRCFKPNYSF